MEYEVLTTLPESAERDKTELALQTSLGPALMMIKGYAAPEVIEAYGRARELCERIDEKEELFPVLWGIAAYSMVRAEHSMAVAEALHLLGIAESNAKTPYLLEGHLLLDATTFYTGDLHEAREQLEEGLRHYDPEQHATLALAYGGLDPEVIGLAYLAWILWLLGYVEQAVAHTDQAQTLIRQLDNTYTLARSLYWDAILRQYIGDWRAVRARADEAITMGSEHGLALVTPIGNIMSGWSRIQMGEHEEGAAQVRQGMAAYRATGAKMQLPHFMIPLVEAARNLGQPEEGLEVLAEALALMESTGERYMEAEFHRLRGELLLELAPDDHAPAEAAFQQAIAVAQAQGAKSLELRAAISLARLCRSQDRVAEAHDLLAPVFDWFTEGFDTADLKEAKALLDELS